MKLLLNTNLIPMFSGTYNSLWDIIEYDEEGKEVFVEYNHQDLMKSIAETYQKNEKDILETIAIPWIKSIHFTGGVFSPREYNFKTDTLDFEIEIDEKEMKKSLDELDGNIEFNGWLHERFTSCDGFMSFTPNNFEGIKEQIATKQSEYDQSVSALIRFLANKKSLIESPLRFIETSMFEDWHGNGYNGCSYEIINEEN